MKNERFVIVGGGLQGCLIALELSMRGHRVLILEQDEVAVNRASLRNEGKIHLGLIYAADPSLSTGILQLTGALNFHRLMHRWLQQRYYEISVSTPFYYLVAKDSVFGVEHLESYYSRLESASRDLLIKDPALSYLGLQVDSLIEPADSEDVQRFFVSDRIAKAYKTSELAIDTDDLASALRDTIADCVHIDFKPYSKVESIDKEGSGYRIHGRNLQTSDEFSINADFVINSTWDQRLKFDMMIGLQPSPNWLHRLKYRAIVGLPEDMLNFPSATVVLGRYGDVVVRPNQTAYLSWYPTCLRGWSTEISPPDSWQQACTGRIPKKEQFELGQEVISRISEWYPSLQRSSLLHVDAGAIFAYGSTDVDDRDSDLHSRTRVGIRRTANYISVNPGKLTTAPLFAMQVANEICGS